MGVVSGLPLKQTWMGVQSLKGKSKANHENILVFILLSIVCHFASLRLG